MLAIIVCLTIIIACAFLILDCMRDYAKTKDNAYICFCTLFSAVLVFMAYGLMHFKPWLNL